MVFQTIRPKAICIIRNGPRILVEYSTWPTDKDIFYVPLGGQIKYGEYGEETIRREIKEEIGAELEEVAAEAVAGSEGFGEGSSDILLYGNSSKMGETPGEAS